MKQLFILLSLFARLTCFSQRETSNWFLQNNRISVTSTGITTGLPTPNRAEFNPINASTSVSDSAGNLLFACDGNKIIDKNLAVMPALQSVNLDCRDGIVQAQKIPNSTRYFVFYNSTVRSPGYINPSWTLKYAIVDLSLNSGAGDVIIYNQVIDTRSSKGYTIVQAAYSRDAWLVIHHNASDSFFSYKISVSGLSGIPVISKAGTNVTDREYFFNDLKTSHDGSMIGGITYREYRFPPFSYIITFVEAFNFDAAIGVVSNKVRSKSLYGGYDAYLSVEFSPDDHLLYAGLVKRFVSPPCGYSTGEVMQFNLCYTDSTPFTRYSMLIAANTVTCSSNTSWGNIQLGADKRIHLPYSGTQVTTISNPNRLGSSSNFIFNSYQLPSSNNGYIATPRFHHKAVEKAVKNNIQYHGSCFPSVTFFNITNDTINNVLWNFGDPASPLNNLSGATVSHRFSAPGFFTVKAWLFNDHVQLIDSLSELVEIKDPNRRLLFGYPTDTSFCEGNTLTLHLNVVNGVFNWYKSGESRIFSETADSFTIDQSGVYIVEMHQNDCDGCIMYDSIHVTVLPSPNPNLGPDRNLCSGDSMRLSVGDHASCIWSTGDTLPSIIIHYGGLYWVQAEINHNGCPRSDSVMITEVPGVQFSLPGDTTLCPGERLLLNPGVSNAFYYLWQNGSTETTYSVTQAGIYWVNITSSNGCSKRDSINVGYFNPQQVFLGNDTILCAGSSLILQSNVFNAQYLWSNGSTADHITVNQTGEYWIAVNDGNCTVRDTIRVSFRSPPDIFLGNDTTLCPYDQLILHSGVANANYLWQNGSQSESLVVTQPGLFWVQVQQYGCTVGDTIIIDHYFLPPLNLGTDINFCSGDSAVLNAGNSFSQYLWNTGAVTQQIIVYGPGNYSVMATTNNGCKAYDSVNVLNIFSLPAVHLNHDPTICSGDSRVLDAGGGFVSYLWNDGTTSRIKIINGTGLYSVTVIDINGCHGTDAVIIDQILPSPANFLPADTTICSYKTLDIQPSHNYPQYFWSNNAITRQINVAPGIYWLQVTDNNNCKGKDSIIINPKKCLEGLFVPSGFTPNNDGKNDVLHPVLLGKINQFHFTIYNRWGNIVFQTEQPGKGWDGFYSGRQQDTNVFMWVCTYQLEGDRLKTEKGTIVLIR